MSEPALKYWAKTAQKYYIHPETEAFTRTSVEQRGEKQFWSLGLEGSRRQLEASADNDRQHCVKVTQYKGDVKDIIIPAYHLAQGIPATVYTPEVLPEVPVVIVYLHGGGLVIATREVYEMCAMTLSRHTKAIVIVPEYRWLPCTEDRFAPFTDCEVATRWVLDNKTAIGGVASSPVGVAGDSAGGQLSCSMTYSIPGKLAFQVLVYPVADIVLEGFESMKDFWDTPGFCGKDMEAMFRWCKLFDEPSQANNPRVNPAAVRTEGDPPLSSSPPTLVLLAQLDPLRDWGISYASKLREAGVLVDLRVLDGCPHVFFSNAEEYPICCNEGHRIVAEFLQGLDLIKT